MYNSIKDSQLAKTNSKDDMIFESQLQKFSHNLLNEAHEIE